MTETEIKTHWGIEKDMPFDARVKKWIDLINERISISSTLIKGNKKNHPELLKGKRKKNYPAIVRKKFITELEDRINRSVSGLVLRGE